MKNVEKNILRIGAVFSFVLAVALTFPGYVTDMDNDPLRRIFLSFLKFYAAFAMSFIMFEILTFCLILRRNRKVLHDIIKRRTVKGFLGAGFFLATVLGTGMVSLAFVHNPQGAYTEGFSSLPGLIVIFYSWFSLVFMTFQFLAIGTMFMAEKVKRT